MTREIGACLVKLPQMPALTTGCHVPSSKHDPLMLLRAQAFAAALRLVEIHTLSFTARRQSRGARSTVVKITTT